MKLDLGRWAHLAGKPPFCPGSVPAFAQVSFGSTSAMMAALLDPSIPLLFENTGKEDFRTLEFGARLQDALGRKITWLEWRPPPVKGDEPKRFGFAEVTFETASRDGTPFLGFMRAMRDYRETKGKPPVTPWARSRICTAHLKHRVKDHFIEAMGIDTYDTFVGLRADEPSRVHGMREAETAKKGFRMPLADAGITKPDVDEFWGQQSFKLELEPYEGNCTACFLKDQTDLARALGNEGVDADWWEALQDEFPGFGGRDKPPYAQLRAEREPRLAIEAALRAGAAPANDGRLDDRRFRLVVLQEKRRLAGDLPAFSCACEQTVKLADQDDDQLSLPWSA